MKPFLHNAESAVAKLLQVFSSGGLGHQSPGNCALTHLLGGEAWLDVIHPVKGTLDHSMKLSDPRRFAYGLKEIRESGFTIAQIIGIESAFSGRVKIYDQTYVSTLDDDTDPGGFEGLSRVLQLFDDPHFHHTPSLKEISIKALV
ncbi:MAG: hypothetical protein SF052_06485 [Bacteroidia bacterium]|nr:hypothetical protein [Bacteroidia bacterium]